MMQRMDFLHKQSRQIVKVMRCFRQMKVKEEIYLVRKELERDGGYAATKDYFQHGNTTVYEHCENVALVSCQIAENFKWRIDKRALIRGALLHDYFLYDWHEKDDSHRLHGFYHAKRALENAKKEFCLNETEKNIIVCHMFPLTLVPPATKEAWIVCIADKWCALAEVLVAMTFRMKGKNVSRNL